MHKPCCVHDLLSKRTLSMINFVFMPKWVSLFSPSDEWKQKCIYSFISSGCSVIFWLIEGVMEPFFKICLYINSPYLAYLIWSDKIFISLSHHGQCYSLQVQSVIPAVSHVHFRIRLYLNSSLVQWKEVRLFLIQWSYSAGCVNLTVLRLKQSGLEWGSEAFFFYVPLIYINTLK